MQVVILCGGLGTRLRDVAEHLPKPMVPIGEKPILWHILRGFAHYHFNQFVLCLGYQSWLIKRYFLDYHLTGADFSLDLSQPHAIEPHSAPPAEDWRLTFAETGLDAQTGCRIKRIERFITGDDFIVTYGDGVGDIDLNRLLDFHHSHGKLATITAVRPPSRFGEIETLGQQVVSFNEKPVVSRGRINGGFMVFKRKFLRRLSDEPSLSLEQEPLMSLARDGELMAYEHDGFWHPMDTSRDHRVLNDLWSSGQAPWKTWNDLPKRPPYLARRREAVAVGAGSASEPLVRPLPRKPR
jgi:glucose-1-phosphate cytidylyltransferase